MSYELRLHTFFKKLVKFIDTKYPYKEIATEQPENNKENGDAENSKFDSRRSLAKIDNTNRTENQVEETKEFSRHQRKLSTFGRKVKQEKFMKKMSNPNIEFYHQQLTKVEQNNRLMSTQNLNRHSDLPAQSNKRMPTFDSPRSMFTARDNPGKICCMKTLIVGFEYILKSKLIYRL